MSADHILEFRFSHVGISVSNMDTALRFYRDGLGFRQGSMIEPQEKLAPLLGVDPPIQLRCQFLRLGPVVVELIEFTAPRSIEASQVPRPLNQVGLTHLSFRVDDVDAMASKLESLGGTIVHSTRTIVSENDVDGLIAFVLDPDGTRIELMSYPDAIQFA